MRSAYFRLVEDNAQIPVAVMENTPNRCCLPAICSGNMPVYGKIARGRSLQEAVTSSLGQWIHLLDRKEMPVFAQTARTLSGIAASRESSAAELSSIILKDPSMTARVLKTANSFFFNPGRRKINTITRAVVMLGFETIRSQCLSIAMVESLGKSHRRERVAREMARAFHAAAQARTFAEKRRDKSPEEVFVATLLLNIGQIAFWSFAGEEAEALDSLIKQPDMTPEQAERRVLGFPLSELTWGLNRKWQLGNLLETALSQKADNDPRVQSIRLGYAVADGVDNGWDSQELDATIGKAAKILHLPVKQVGRLVEDNAREAIKMAEDYGAKGVIPYIPQPARGAAASAHAEAVMTDEPLETTDGSNLVTGLDSFPETDPMLQLHILQELTSAIETGIDLTTLLDMTLEGITRAVGMDRVVFAMISRDRKSLRARHSMGWDAMELKQSFVFDLQPGEDHLFRHLIDEQEAVWVRPDSPDDIRARLAPRLLEICGDQSFFAMPTVVNGRSIGLFYADRRPSKRPLDEEIFIQFKHFCQQAAIGINFISGHK